MWRWLSLSERYFGIALSTFVEDDSNEPFVQIEIKNAAFRHHTLSCRFGSNFSPILVVESASYALQVCNSYDITYSSDSYVEMVNRLLENLLAAFIRLPSTGLDFANHVLQRLFLHLIELRLYRKESATALELIEKGLQHLQPVYQKPIWQKKLLVLSTQGTENDRKS